MAIKLNYPHTNPVFVKQYIASWWGRGECQSPSWHSSQPRTIVGVQYSHQKCKSHARKGFKLSCSLLGKHEQLWWFLRMWLVPWGYGCVEILTCEVVMRVEQCVCVYSVMVSKPRGKARQAKHTCWERTVNLVQSYPPVTHGNKIIVRFWGWLVGGSSVWTNPTSCTLPLVSSLSCHINTVVTGEGLL